MDGDLVVGLSVVVAIVVIAISLIYAAKRSSQGYYDDYGRKIPLDEFKNKGDQQDAEITRLREHLKIEEQQATSVLEKLGELEKRIEALEKRGA